MTSAAPDLRSAAAGPLARRLPPRYLAEHAILPLRVADDGSLVLAAQGTPHPLVLDEVARVFGREVQVVAVPASDIQAALMTATGASSEGTGDARRVASDAAPEEGGEAPSVQLVNSMLLEALRAGASDVHVESTQDGVRVRFRLDGVLHDMLQLAPQYRASVVSRIKIMAGLDIGERRIAQDGRSVIHIADRDVDVRVSIVPALHGENVVLRILDRTGSRRALPDIGMEDGTRTRFERMLAGTNGMILVTGPTGSGKTTTLYGAIDQLNAPGVKVVAIEDPVEFQTAGITQIPANPRAGFGFASALRAILRHDPDIVMVGEMRDRETAELAVQASLTGHLVLSTLHTNDAVAGIVRLADMGIEPYLVAATVRGILAQRLVRVACRACGGGGCASCSGTGFRGRTGIYELMEMTDRLREMVVARRPLEEMRHAAREDGMTTLRDAGMALVARGITTVQEVLRVTGHVEPEEGAS